MKYYILGGLIAALVVVAASWIREPTKVDPRDLRTQEMLAERARKMDDEGEESLVIGHKPIMIPSDVETNAIYVGSSTVYVLNVSNLTKDYTNLFQLQIDGVPIVTVKPNGDVIYDTNNVSEATRIFWQEMTYQARKVTERIGK